MSEELKNGWYRHSQENWSRSQFIPWGPNEIIVSIRWAFYQNGEQVEQGRFEGLFPLDKTDINSPWKIDTDKPNYGGPG